MHQQIQQCINDCQQTMNQLRSLANQAANPQARDMLNEGAHHLELCVTECQYAAQRAQQQPAYQAGAQPTAGQPRQTI